MPFRLLFLNSVSAGVVAAVLSLNFASMTLGATLASAGVTFVRPSLATQFDAAGKLTFCPNNLLTYSNTYTNAAWGKTSSASVSGNILTFGTPGNFASMYQLFSAPVGTKVMFGITLSGSGTLHLDGQNLDNVRVVTLTSTPTVYSFVGTVIGANPFPRIISYPGDTATSVTLGNSFVAAVTYETSPRVADQVVTTASAYYGPRFDYDPVTQRALGILIEESRTNRLTQSKYFNDVAWSKTCSVAYNVTGPDSVANGSATLTGTAANNNCIYQSISSSSGDTLSFIVKAGSSNVCCIWVGSGIYGWFDLAAGVASYTSSCTSAIKSLGNGWYICSVTLSASGTVAVLAWADAVVNSDFFNTSSTVGRTIQAYSGQLETGSTATSYIPTSTSAVTRAADNASITGSAFSSFWNSTEGTIVIETPDGISQSGSCRGFTVSYPSGGTPYQVASTLIYSNGNSLIADGPSTGLKHAIAIQAGNHAIVHDGGTPITGVGPFTNCDHLDIGHFNGYLFLNGHVRSLNYYNTRRPNAELRTLTA